MDSLEKEEKKKISAAQELKKSVAKTLKVTQHEAEEMIKAIFDEITTQIKEKGSVRIEKFGTFKMQFRAAHRGYNPRSGSFTDIKASSNISFRNSKVLKDKLSK